MPPHLPCPVEGCEYRGQNEKSLAGHLQVRHPEELKAPAPPPKYQAIPNARRAAIYLRVSTIDQYPENQLPGCITFAGARGFEVVAQYVDKASGKNMDRPDLKRLMADAQTGLFDVVVFRRMSRLGRSLKDNIFLFDYFQRLGIAMVSTEEPFDTTTAAGRLIRNVMASVAEYQRENMIEMVKEGNDRRRREGKPMGRHPNGCGILFPCPSGTNHKLVGTSDLQSLLATEAKRKYKAEKQRAYRQHEKRKSTNGSLDHRVLALRTDPAPQGV